VTFRLTEEQKEIRALARDFAQGELRPRGPEWDGQRVLDPAIFAKLGELGFMGMRIPEEYGGLDLDLATYLQALEALAWGDASVALSVAIHSGPVSFLLNRYGTEEQRARWLPPMASGETLGAFSLSEPEAGSDAGSLQTTWRREEGSLIISGRKKWVTNGDSGGLILLFARAESGGPISAFLVDREAQGYKVGKREKTMGFAASETFEVTLEELRLQEEAFLGEEGEGFRYALEALDVGRLGIAALALGIASAAFEHARDYAKERVQFGRPLSDFQATRFKLADMAVRLAETRALVAAATDAMEQAEPWEERRPGTLAAMAKLVASEAAVWTADEAVQIFGGYGYMRHYPVERLLRDAKGTEVIEGTSEIMRLVVARDVLRESGA